MKGRENKGPPSADLLVCFPSRAHLTLMPKPICSPARPSEPNKRHHNHHKQQQHNHHHHRHRHHLRKSSSKSGAGQASPLLWAKTKPMGSEISSEPTSPKVTCAGQIKVRHNKSACKSWQSVMEEIEKIHNGKHKKKSTWMESLGLKREIMQFLTCLRSIRFDFRCLRSFPQADISTEDDEDEEEDEVQHHDSHVGGEGSEGSESSRTVFSKWFMMLQENQNSSFCKEERGKKHTFRCEDQSHTAASVPPPNALLLMRCRSAPANNWLEKRGKEDDNQEREHKEADMNKQEKKGKNLKTLIEEEKRNAKKESLIVMKYDTDFYKISTDIAKETWVVGGIRDPLSRSRSWKT
ncbi:hypothetical protein K2173_026806 [Erythroxylum novogranatense]|uniref:Uncharacterized protein n=1 Tax=Erythroxylum novogranatense TaxID=1862640 RepID=A0AAV8U0G7_9ROSI|nr:hypothetical protein K2173_026806 [Erythroxylum novogranatense]